MANVKVVFVGNSNTCKSFILKRLMGRVIKPIPIYAPTLGVGVEVYRSPSNKTYGIWDCAGDSRYKGLGKSYYSKARVAIIFTSDDEDSTYGCSVDEYIQDLRSVSPSVIIHVLHNATLQDVRTILA